MAQLAQRRHAVDSDRASGFLMDRAKGPLGVAALVWMALTACHPEKMVALNRVDVSALQLDFVDIRPSHRTRIVEATVTLHNPTDAPIEFDLRRIHLKHGNEDVEAKVISLDRDADTVVTLPPAGDSKRLSRKLAHPGTRFRLLFELERVPSDRKDRNHEFYVCCGGGR